MSSYHSDDNLRTLLEDLLNESGGADSAGSIPFDIPGFEIGEFLGEGGTSLVFKARQISTGQMVAIKFLRADLIHRRIGQRMKRECAALVRLDSRAFPRIIDSGELRGIGFIVQEFVKGKSLCAFIEESGCDAGERLQLMIRIARCVGLAHQQGIIHRDLKPANILIREDGSPVVVDFGIAGGVEGGGAAGFTMTITVPGGVMGTPAYMAPEQARGETDIGTECDVYSLGVILYEMLIGTLPKFDEHDTTVVIPSTALIQDNWSDRKRINQFLGRVMAKALDSIPESRYTNASEFAEELQALIDGEPVKAPRLTSAWLLKKNRSRLITGAILVLILAMTGLGILFYPVIFPEDQPIARRGAAMAFDPVLRKIIMFGGISSYPSKPMLSDFWYLNNDHWKQIKVLTPGARIGSAMVADTARNQVVLVGGSDESYFRKDTFIWDGKKWAVLSIKELPPLGGQAVIFDTINNRCFLFGGTFQESGLAHTPRTFSNDLYELLDDGWHLVDVPNPRPQERASHAMAYDVSRHCIVLYGGHWISEDENPNNAITFHDTWEYSDGRWIERIADHPVKNESEEPAEPIGMVYDQSMNACILVDELGRTWKWDGSSWTIIKTQNSPGIRYGVALAYNPLRDRIVLFGGNDADGVPLGDTWIFEKNEWHQMTEY